MSAAHLNIERVGVVGCGLMGSGIAEVVARAGRDVVVLESSEGAIEAGMARIDKSLARAVRSAKMTEEEQAHTLSLLSFTSDPTALADRELVI